MPARIDCRLYILAETGNPLATVRLLLAPPAAGKTQYYIDLLYRDVVGWHLVLFTAVSIGVNGDREESLQDYKVRIARYRTGLRKLLGETFSAKLCLLDDGGDVSLLEI